MKRVVGTLLLLVSFLVGGLAAAPSPWTAVANKVSKSISYLEGNEGSCTAFSINEKSDLVLTAAHCDMSHKDKDDFLVDNIPASVVAKDSKKDLLVLHVTGIDKPALHLAKENPRIGETVASYGYGLGLERPIFRLTNISDDQTIIPELNGPYVMTDTNFIPGQSGGPVVDTDGNLVMIVQMGSSQGLGLGVGAETIKAKMGRYFEKESN